MKPRPLRVLIVDPHADAAASLALLLELVGHAPTVASTAAAAVEAGPFDAALVELRLPDGDGWELAHRLRGDAGPGALVVAVTCLGRPADRRRSAAMGLEHFLKPVDPEVLLDRLARHAAAAVLLQ